MTLYIDTKLNFTDSNVVSTLGSWHPSLPLLALGSYNQEKGGFVTIFQENGLALEGCEWPILLSNQVTALAWHPTRKLLVVGWDGGELYIWLEYSWARLEAPHNAALTTVAFSLGGGRLLASDAAGSVSGWQSASGAPLTSFHHQLGDVITHVTFCPVHPTGESSIRGLARAAVAGDENALDALAAWRPRTTARIREGSQPDNHACYAAQDNGVILYIDHAGSCSEVLNAPGNVIFMGMIGTIYILVAWENAGALSLTRFITADDGTLTTDTHVRMAARNGQCIVLAGSYSVAVITGDNLLRVWDSENGDNDVLPNENDETTPGDIFTSISYCNLSDTLCCGTSQGNLYLWRRDPRNHWKLISSTCIKGTVKEVSWGSEGLMNPLLHVNCITSAFILREQPVCWGYSPNVCLVQKSANEIAITNGTDLTSSIKTQITVRALAFKDHYVALCDGKEVQVWMCSKDNDTNFSQVRAFSWKTDILFLCNDVLVGVVNPHIECYSITGNNLGILPSTEGEGEPIGITNTGKFVVIATMDGTLKLAEITKKGLKMPYPPKNCYQMIEDFGEVMRASVNCNGRYICLSIANAGLAPDPRLYLWDAANDGITNTLLSDSQLPPYQSVPITIMWDAHDPRIVAVHMRSTDVDRIHLFFCHEGNLFEYKNWCPSSEQYFMSDFILCSLYTPYVVILSQQTITRILMHEFEEPNQDESNLKQTLDFLYCMTTGNLEKAVVVGTNLTGVRSSVIWDSLAKECVSRRRPDVGAVCLGKMGNIKGALMMRKAMNGNDMDETCQIGVLAINLGMLEEAEKLFREAERPDLITRLMSAKEGGLHEITTGSNEGENILLIKSAQHKLAKIMWANGETGAALKLFESAGTLVPHVPRMLIAQGQAPVLAQYVATSSDPNLIMWWGHYLESVGDLDGALDAYGRANDFGEQTRLLCHMQRIDEAEKLSQKNPAAMYQMARYLEMQPDKIESAVKLYIKCGAVASAIRVATEASAWNLVWRAGSSSPMHALHAAAILENAEQTEQAIALYQKAGKPHMALKLALSCGDTGAMVAAVESLGERVDADLARTLAAHLRRAERHEHAAALLATAGQYEEALDIVEQSGTPLTEALAERLAAPEGAAGRDALLRRLADALGASGLYRHAAKRLAQSGDKVTAPTTSTGRALAERSGAPLAEALAERLAAPEGAAGRDALLRRLADALGASGLYRHAAKRLAQSGDKVTAPTTSTGRALAERSGAPLAEALAERLAAPEGAAGRDALLRRLADALGASGLYRHAAKRLAQSGDKVTAPSTSTGRALAERSGAPLAEALAERLAAPEGAAGRDALLRRLADALGASGLYRHAAKRLAQSGDKVTAPSTSTGRALAERSGAPLAEALAERLAAPEGAAGRDALLRRLADALGASGLYRHAAKRLAQSGDKVTAPSTSTGRALAERSGAPLAEALAERLAAPEGAAGHDALLRRLADALGASGLYRHAAKRLAQSGDKVTAPSTSTGRALAERSGAPLAEALAERLAAPEGAAGRDALLRRLADALGASGLYRHAAKRLAQSGDKVTAPSTSTGRALAERSGAPLAEALAERLAAPEGAAGHDALLRRLADALGASGLYRHAAKRLAQSGDKVTAPSTSTGRALAERSGAPLAEALAERLAAPEGAAGRDALLRRLADALGASGLYRHAAKRLAQSGDKVTAPSTSTGRALAERSGAPLAEALAERLAAPEGAAGRDALLRRLADALGASGLYRHAAKRLAQSGDKVTAPSTSTGRALAERSGAPLAEALAERLAAPEGAAGHDALLRRLADALGASGLYRHAAKRLAQSGDKVTAPSTSTGRALAERSGAPLAEALAERLAAPEGAAGRDALLRRLADALGASGLYRHAAKRLAQSGDKVTAPSTSTGRALTERSGAPLAEALAERLAAPEGAAGHDALLRRLADALGASGLYRHAAKRLAQSGDKVTAPSTSTGRALTERSGAPLAEALAERLAAPEGAAGHDALLRRLADALGASGLYRHAAKRLAQSGDKVTAPSTSTGRALTERSGAPLAEALAERLAAPEGAAGHDALLRRLADALGASGLYRHAAKRLAQSGDKVTAPSTSTGRALAERSGAPLAEALAERLAAPEGAAGRDALLRRLADALGASGLYRHAAKRLAQSGDKVTAPSTSTGRALAERSGAPLAEALAERLAAPEGAAGHDALLRRLADALGASGLYRHAAKRLAQSGDKVTAPSTSTGRALAERSGAPLAEALAERLAAPEGAAGRDALLRRLADALGASGLYRHAAKRLAQSGDKVTAPSTSTGRALAERSGAPLAEALAERLAAPEGAAGRDALLRRLADALGASGLYRHAAKRLAQSGDKVTAPSTSTGRALAERSGAPLAEALAERLAAPEGAAGHDALLRRLADALGASGLYRHAAKRLAQSGDKAGAMRWLMRSGEADRIATFAAAARDRSAQLMAADWLRRHAGWRARPDLTRHILHFYTRAKAHGKLAAFYAECASMEAEDHENYEKALEALKEATKCLSKTSDPDTGSQIMALQEQSSLVKKFIDVKKLLESGEINAGVASGQQLLRTVSGRPGLVTEEKVLKTLLQLAPNHPDVAVFEKQLKQLQKKPQEDSRSVESPDQSIEEVI